MIKLPDLKESACFLDENQEASAFKKTFLQENYYQKHERFFTHDNQE